MRDPAVQARRRGRVREHARARARGRWASAVAAVGPSGNHEFFLHLASPRDARWSAGRGPRRMKRIGFAFNPTNEPALELRERALGWCAVRGIDAWASEAGARGAAERDCPTPRRSSCWAATARSCAPPSAVAEVDVPILGINSGKVGFLSKAESEHWRPCSALLAEGAYDLEPRMMLEARLLPAGRRRPRPPYIGAQRGRHRARRAGAGRAARGERRWLARGDLRRRRPGRERPRRARPATPSAPAARSSTRPAGTSWSRPSPPTCPPSARSSSAPTTPSPCVSRPPTTA